MKPQAIMKAMRCAALPALLLCPPAARAAEFSADASGSATAQFLKLASGARGAGLGEAYAALADDAFAMDWNPAGLSSIKNKSMVFMHSPYLAGTYLDYFAYAENAGDVGSWGFAAKYMSFGEISRTDSSGMETGKLAPYDLSGSVGFSAYISGFNKDPEDRFILGATGKFVRSKIQETDSTISADLGLLTPLMFDGAFRVGLAAQNIMGSLRFDTEEAPLPLVLRFGTVTRLSSHFLLTADLVGPRDHLPYLAAGAEARIAPSADMDVFLRGGFNTHAAADLSGTRNIALGAGLRYGAYTLDYAFSPFGDLGNVHRVSIAIAFEPSELPLY